MPPFFSYWKKRMKKTLKLLLTLSFLSPCFVFAKEEPITDIYNQPGPYVELNAGVNLYHFDYFVVDSGFSGVGLNTNVGYQFTPYFALEGGYIYFVSGVGGHMLHFVAKGILPLGTEKRFKLFAKLGPGIEKANGNSSLGFGVLHGGIGAGYSATPNLDVNLQLQGETVGFASVGLLSIGLAYHFN